MLAQKTSEQLWKGNLSKIRAFDLMKQEFRIEVGKNRANLHACQIELRGINNKSKSRNRKPFFFFFFFFKITLKCVVSKTSWHSKKKRNDSHLSKTAKWQIAAIITNWLSQMEGCLTSNQELDSYLQITGTKITCSTLSTITIPYCFSCKRCPF